MTATHQRDLDFSQCPPVGTPQVDVSGPPEASQVVVVSHRPPDLCTHGSNSLVCTVCLAYTPYSDTETSLEAAHFQAQFGKAKGDEARVWKWLYIHGPATDDAMEIALRISHQTLSARRRGLVIKGRCEATGERAKTRTGRAAQLWRAV